MKILLTGFLGSEHSEPKLFFDGQLGFGRNYSNSSEKYHEKYSFVNTMYNIGKIPKKMFGIKYFSDRKYIRLYIGEINLEEFNGNKKYPRCFVQQSITKLALQNEEFYHLWSCELKRITLYDSEGKEHNNTLFEYNLSVNTSIVFSTVSNIISGPLQQGELLLSYQLILKIYYTSIVVGRWIYISFLIFILS